MDYKVWRWFFKMIYTALFLSTLYIVRFACLLLLAVVLLLVVAGGGGEAANWQFQFSCDYCIIYLWTDRKNSLL
jgi:hypothetical protein